MSSTVSGIRFTPAIDDINIEIFVGKSLNFTVIWGGETPIDITGFSAVFIVRDYNGVAMLERSTQNGGISLGGVTGTLLITATPEQTRKITAAGIYELQLTTNSGVIYRALSGTVSPIPEIA